MRIQHLIAAVKRVFEILDTPISVKDPEDEGRAAHPWPQGWNEIQFKNVQFKYAAAGILNGIDLTVKRGELVAIVGSSGAGKSTLVNLLPRFYDVSGGAIEIGGQDIRNIKLKALRANTLAL